MRRARILPAVVAALALFASAATASPASSLKVTWHHKCVAKFRFCADFPYVNGAQWAYQYHHLFDSGTSVSGKLDSYSSHIYLNKRHTQLCKLAWSNKCPHEEVYLLEVIRSKYSDPWMALTALNGGVKNARREHYRGNLAVRFTGLYGPVGYAIYHDGLVYYMEEGDLDASPNQPIPRYARQFVESIRFN